jgi:NAD(P)H-dependent FMN reductase
MMSTSRIAALAKEIETQTTKLDKFFAESQLPPPSFDEDAPLMYPFPPDVAEAQEALSAALDELWWLNQGPIQTIVAKSVCHEQIYRG